MQPLISYLSQIFSWSDLQKIFYSLSNSEKGELFEILTKIVLRTKPYYKSILKNVWILREGIPNDIKIKLNLPSTDEGIDLVAETYSGEYWAIQCKFKGKNQTPTYKELSTFGNLANNYCNNISLALLVHTGEKGVKKRILLGENYSEIGLDFWLSMESDDWERVHHYLEGKSTRPFPKEPRPHQKKAIDCAFNHFEKKKNSRGRLIMPCGTGKSLTAFWIANILKAQSIIIAVPSLSLIKQSLENWTKEFIAKEEEPVPNWLVICSDESTAKLEKDEFVSNVYSLGIPTTTDSEKIIHFLKSNQKGRKIIFTTYQSSLKLVNAAYKCKFIFDLAILDEAHKTVGLKTKTFATLISNKNISISKRLFMTATERVFRGKNDDIFSMDDEKVYGKLFYQLSFKDAINSNPPIICDYKILTVMVTNEEIKRLILRNNLLTDKKEKIEEQEAQSLATALVLRKAAKKYGFNHAISFHSNIKRADNFAQLQLTLNTLTIDNSIVVANHISGKKSAGERAKLLNDFEKENLALLTNARCLTEGIDIPAIDCVLFSEPKQSIVDIVQASGRALRPKSGKEFGYIMLPLIVPENQSLEEFAESTPFKTVVRIVSALSTQDERIAEEFRLIQKGKSYTSTRIVFDGNIPASLNLDFDFFVESIKTKIWERVARVNWLPFNEARKYVHNLHISGSREWYNYCKSVEKPFDIPITPQKRYLGRGWINWGDWLGTNFVSLRKRIYLPYLEAREYVQKLNLRTCREWKKYLRSGKRPTFIPLLPEKIYNNEGWIGYGDWLGTGNLQYKEINYLSFEESRTVVQRLRLKNTQEWKKYCRSGKKPINIPSAPERLYKDSGWKGIGDWIGTDSIAMGIKGNRKYDSYKDAIRLVHSLKLNTKEEWFEYYKSKKPKNLPPNPYVYYRKRGWKSWDEYLGV